MILPCWLHGIFEVRAEAQPEASGIVGQYLAACNSDNNNKSVRSVYVYVFPNRRAIVRSMPTSLCIKAASRRC